MGLDLNFHNSINKIIIKNKSGLFHPTLEKYKILRMACHYGDISNKYQITLQDVCLFIPGCSRDMNFLKYKSLI